MSDFYFLLHFHVFMSLWIQLWSLFMGVSWARVTVITATVKNAPTGWEGKSRLALLRGAEEDYLGDVRGLPPTPRAQSHHLIGPFAEFPQSIKSGPAGFIHLDSRTESRGWPQILCHLKITQKSRSQCSSSRVLISVLLFLRDIFFFENSIFQRFLPLFYRFQGSSATLSLGISVIP